MCPVHVRAEPGDFAESVLLPGDPLRAKYIAETFFEDAKLVTEERGMLGYTGTYRANRSRSRPRVWGARAPPS